MKKELIEIFESFKKSPLRFLKRNLSLLIILPALFGGLWQVIELSRMSFSFIRFFSVGQIIPDGLLILLFLIIFLISTFIFLYFWRKLDDEEDDSDNIPKKANTYYSILLFLLFLFFIFLIINANLYFIDNIDSIISLFFFLPVNIVLLLCSYITFHYSFQHCREINFFGIRNLLFQLRLIPLLIQVFMLLLFTVKFHRAFVFPIELQNMQNLFCKMEKIDDGANYEILYYNDKYVFIECHKFVKDINGKPRQSEIRIFRFEELLDDSSCIGSKRIRAEFVRDSIWDSKQPAKLKDIR